MTVDRDYAFPVFRQGMDHEHYAWSPLNGTRPQLAWPGNAPVAVCPIVVLEHAEWRPPAGSFQVPGLAGGYGWGPLPDVTAWSHREYGHRVGVFRVLDVLVKHGIKPTVAVDALTAEHYPYLIDHCKQLGCEFIAHGQSVSRTITSKMSEAEELGYIQSSIDAVATATGSKPIGWFGPEHGESARTPELLARCGIEYVCDWVNDEQPYPLRVSQGSLHALPISLHLDDVQAFWLRRMDADRYGEMVGATFSTLKQEGASNARLLTLTLHPFLIGQPFRIVALDGAINGMAHQGGAWFAQAHEIIDWYRRERPTLE